MRRILDETEERFMKPLFSGQVARGNIVSVSND